jgi:hypothetical protein
MKQDHSEKPELEATVSGLQSACVDRDAAQVSAGVTQLFACLKQLECDAADSGPSLRSPAAGWLLTKCAENLRELEWQMPTRWDEVARTIDLAEKCAFEMSEPVGT